MTYAMYTLDKTAPTLAAVLALHRARHGEPGVVLTQEPEAVEGVEVRQPKAGEGTVGRGIVWIALTEYR